MTDALVLRNRLKLSLEGARVILEGAERRARELGIPMDIAVVDEGGMLLAFHRMDGAKLTGVDIAINKAFTAAGTRRGTHEYVAIAQPGGGAFGIHASNQGRFTVFPGGLPVVVEGHVIGGAGASSGSGEQDQEVVQAGIDMLLERLQKAC